jgi:prepilin-type N-terminal cleavage/methylation domain-containing protein/prepilin-type processing-associated H-X9-DG protein
MTKVKAFTLSELMVVIAIIALLVAMLVPTLNGLSTTAKRVLCINNLNKINQASQTWASQCQTWSQNALAEGGWTAVVTSLTQSLDLLKCPEGGPLVTGTSVESLIVIRTSPTSDVAIPLIEMNANGGFAGAFKVLKLSSEQFKVLGECQRFTPVPYVVGANPNVYYWCYDDGAIGTGDYDFQDLTIKVTKNFDGTVTIFVLADTGGNPEVWSADLKTQYADTHDINQHHYSGKGVERVIQVGSVTNYGMNNAKIDMRSLSKVQVLDYADATAASTDNWDAAEWDKNKDKVPDFIRHGGKLNAAMLDGSAKSYYRWELDPSDVTVERTLWQKED